MKDHYYNFTIGLNNSSELYQFDSSRSKFIGTDKPQVLIFLTRPLVAFNPIANAVEGTKFSGITIRQYDLAGVLLKKAEYRDVVVTRLDKGPDLILEFTYNP